MPEVTLNIEATPGNSTPETVQENEHEIQEDESVLWQNALSNVVTQMTALVSTTQELGNRIPQNFGQLIETQQQMIESQQRMLTNLQRELMETVRSLLTPPPVEVVETPTETTPPPVVPAEVAPPVVEERPRRYRVL